MRKLFKEEILPDAQRQIKGIGSEQPMQNVAVPSTQSPQIGNNTTTQSTPFPLDAEKVIFDTNNYFQKLTNIRNDMESSLKNPSIKDSQKANLNSAIKKLDRINRLLLYIPIHLRSFVARR